ncbi:hypothetical protein Vretimale_9193 [Volvox reticuliferus]|uniref:Sulfhydryl oxidase n=1 Tax=Volvox reticuliferus TaxID=1737510 RepID=A0A8J4CDF0_9CHLO|nr:hypothetical protein Vretifemale_9983 [Volvox reticuliferus]GIM04695.1 hypothetical protein Vretimale_9193 [Volvox reticuliferus]
MRITMIRLRGSSVLFLVSWLFHAMFLQPWTINAEPFMHSDVAAQISTANFTQALNSLGTDQVCLIEFYASWCPACKHFAPKFEKFAKFLKDKRLGGRLLYIARVDCATEVDLCGVFNVPGYPALFLGQALDFLAKDPKKLQVYHGHDRELQHLASWVGEYFKTELIYSDVEGGASVGGAGSSAAHISSTTAKRRPLPNGPEWSLADVEGATLQLWSIVVTTPILHRGAEKRAALRGILEGWAAAHPSTSCKSHATGLLSSYDKIWPAGEEEAPAALLQSEPCGPPSGLTFRGEWVTCRGSKPNSRGYSCGLWEMLHTMALRFPDKPGAAGPAQAMMTFMTLFNTHFFQCAPCQKHFGRILASPEAAAVTDRRTLSLWLWRVHNEVNERLRGIEAQYGHSTTGDPEFPKEQWPTPESCPQCRASNSLGTWVEDRVWEHLQRVFGVGSAPGADGVKSGTQLQLGQSSRIRTSIFYSLLPVLGVAAAALLLFLVVRGNMVLGRRGRGSGVVWSSAAK